MFPYERLDVLLRELDVNLAQLAAFLHYDVSYLSKIRTGKRRPANPEVFMEKVCIYVVKNSPWTEIQPRIAALTGRVDACSEIGAAIRLLEQAGATVAGVGIVIAKSFQPGLQRLRDAGYRVEVLASVRRMGENLIEFED